jgi:hypothetical protein
MLKGLNCHAAKANALESTSPELRPDQHPDHHVKPRPKEGGEAMERLDIVRVRLG